MDKKIVMAPMSGITDYPFRCIARSLGAKYVVSEMTVSNALIRNIVREKSYIDESPAIVQIAGNDPKIMSQAAKIIEEKGADIIDINMGCPAKKIAINSYAGAALLKDENLAIEIVKSVIKSVKIPVTVKMRTGWNHQHIIPLAIKLQNEGVQSIAIHGRTRNEMYSGNADWQYIYSVKNSLKIPVMGNGDIKNIYDAQKKIRNLNGIMIGRGIYGRPWFINQVDKYINEGIILNDPSIEKQKNILLEHLNKILSFYGVEKGKLIARKHIGWYIRGLKNATIYKNEINKSSTINKMIQLICNLYDSQ